MKNVKPFNTRIRRGQQKSPEKGWKVLRKKEGNGRSQWKSCLQQLKIEQG
jgi:hypothetical protein